MIPASPTVGPRGSEVNPTRTLASVSASPILNHDHGRYQPLTRYVSHATACPATNTGTNTSRAPRRTPDHSNESGRACDPASLRETAVTLIPAERRRVRPPAPA